MRHYIGTKMVEAERCTKVDGKFYGEDATVPCGADIVDGYKIRYADGYESFSPKDVFEKAYLPLEPNKKLKTDAPSISQKMVDDFISEIHVVTLGEKTTVVRVVLVNGFEIVESSSCVSKENYDQRLGEEICMEKIKGKIWLLLGFLLQTAVNGVEKPEETTMEQEDESNDGWAEPARDLEQEYEEQVEQEKECEACGKCGDEHKNPSELPETIRLMLSDDFKERVKGEYWQLKIRRDKLKEMCDKYAAGELTFTPSCPLTILLDQVDAMDLYMEILEKRAEMEDIDLMDANVFRDTEEFFVNITGKGEGCTTAIAGKVLDVIPALNGALARVISVIDDESERKIHIQETRNQLEEMVKEFRK